MENPVVIGEGWGGAPWGATPWGTGEPELALLAAVAVRENCVRVEFSAPPLIDGLLTPHDASDPERFGVMTVSGVSLTGELVRPVTPVFVELPALAGAGGRFLDVWVDRPMTGWPAVYRITANGLAAASGGSILSAGSSVLFPGVRAGTSPLTPEFTMASRDLLIAQTARELEGANVSGDPSKMVGVLVADARGDYASGTPLAGYRTRVIRRAITALGSFSHLPTTYGTPLASSVKKPFKQSIATDIAAQMEAQITLEPETLTVTVTVIAGENGSVFYRIVATARVGVVDTTVAG